MKYLITLLFIILSGSLVTAQNFNYLEENVGTYTLPPVLIPTKKTDSLSLIKDWEEKRRTAILNLFKANVYGVYPNKPKHPRFKIQRIDSLALNGTAISKQIRCYFPEKDSGAYMDIIFYSPTVATKKVPVFIGLNFKGNYSINSDTNILISRNYLAYSKIRNKNKEADSVIRGNQAERWELETLIAKGYGVATAFYGDLEFDYAEGWKNGIRTLLAKELGVKPEEWPAIGAWAWGLSRITDYLDSEERVDKNRIIVTGHSRLGKAALWAGVNDTRFAAVISNNSGEGGAALSRRSFGETIRKINTSFPHWFIDKYKTYNDKPDLLPVDQHMLLALVAPRPLYVASATKDLWADPKGEFLGAKNAEPAYNLYSKKGLGPIAMPPPDTSVGNFVHYHIRTGKHNILLYDWLQYVDFADKYVK